MIWRALAICLVSYFFCAKGYLEVVDTTFSLKTAQAMVSRIALDIPYAEGFSLEGPDGKSYSKYGIGLPVYYVPLVVLGNILSGVTGLSSSALTAFLISFASIPFALLALMMFAQLLQLFERVEAERALLLLGLGLGTLTWRYACSDFSEAMQMGLLMVAVYGVIRRTTPAIVAGGLAFAYLLLVKLLYLVFLPILVVYLLTWPGERIQRTAWFALPSVLAGLIIAWLNAVRFGSVFESGYGGEAGLFFPDQIWSTVPQLLGSLDKGLFVFCPVLVLGAFGWKAFAAKHRPEALLCASLILVNLILTSAWHSWFGGWSWGPRLLVPTIPLWFLPAAFVGDGWRPRMRQLVLAAAVFASTLLQIPGMLINDNEIHQLKDNMLSPAEQAAASSDSVAAWILVRHKLLERDERFRISEFNIPGERTVDLSGFKWFAGLNLWSEQMAKALNKPALRWFPLLGMLAAAYLLMQLARQLWNQLSKCSNITTS